MNKASESELSDLHGTLARTLKALIQGGEASSAVLNVARQFLKDNGIECVGEENAEIREIVDSIPDTVGVDDFE